MIIKKLPLLFASMLIFVSSFGQDKLSGQIDSLSRIAESSKGIVQFDAMIGIMRLQLKSNPQEALRLSQQLEKIAYTLGDSLRIVQAKFAKGFIYRRIDSLNQAIKVLEQAMEIAKRNRYDDELSKILNTTALAYSFSGNPDKALTLHFQSIELNEALGRNEEIAITYNNIGLVYFKLKDYDNSLKFYQKSLDLKKSISDGYDLDRLYINMALCFNQLKRYKDSEEFVKLGLELCKDNCDPFIKMDAELCLGIALSEQKKSDVALSHFQTSLTLSKQLKNKRYQIESLLNLAIVKEQQGYQEDALNHLVEAEVIARETNYSLSLIEIYKLFSKIYSKQQNFEFSASYQSKYIQLKDSIYSEELIKNLAKVQTNFAERENIKTIKEKDQILELKQALINRQRAQYFFIIVITLLVFGLALVLLMANRRQQRANSEIASAKVIIEEKNQLLAIQNKTLDDQNKELDARVKARTKDLTNSTLLLSQVNEELDNFIYKSSHDLRGPLMTLQGLCNLGMMETSDPIIVDILGKVREHSDKMAKILSRLMSVWGINEAILCPGPVNLAELLDGIIYAKRDFSTAQRVSITYSIHEEVELLSDPDLIHAILENLIDNGIKFCNNSERINSFVKISVNKFGKQVKIIVEDNGIGISGISGATVFHMFTRASERSETGGVGLYLAKVCTNKLGGEIILDSSSKDGTKFIVSLPANINEIIIKRMELEHDLMELEKTLAEEAKKMLTSA